MKKILSILLLLAFMAVACAFAEGDQEAENYTRYFDYTPVENAPIGLVPGENHNTLVMYFSRVGNTAFPEEVDAVSYASQNVTEGEKLVGTAQMVAGWIVDETGGDVFPIQTAFTYPEAFWDTVTVIEGQEKGSCPSTDGRDPGGHDRLRYRLAGDAHLGLQRLPASAVIPGKRRPVRQDGLCFHDALRQRHG